MRTSTLLIRVARHVAFGLRCVALLCCVLAITTAAAWAQGGETQPAAALEATKTKLDQVEAALGRETLTSQMLADLRRTIIAVRDELRGTIEQLEPRAREAEERLKQLGPAPAKDAPPEDEAIAAERERLSETFAQLDGALKQARVLALRTEQLSERITEQRRALYARELFHRSASILDPAFWTEAADALPSEQRSFGFVLRSWSATLKEAGTLRLSLALALVLALVIIALAITRWWLPRFDAGPTADTRLARARTALWVSVWLAVRTPLTIFAAVLVFEAFGLLPYRVREIADGLVVAVIAASFGRGVARGLLAPDKPARRIVRFDDATAASFHDHLVWSTRAFAAAIFAQTVHKTLYAPLSVTIATNGLFALAYIGLLFQLVRRLRGAELERPVEGLAHTPGARLAAWFLILVIIAALLSGYGALAAFVALRAVVAAAVFGALYLLLNVTDALFSESLAETSRRAHIAAANFGVSPRTVALFATIFSALLRIVLIVFALMIILGPWEVSTADLLESVQSVPLAFRIGEINLSFRAILAAAAVLIVVLMVTRAGQRWMETELLPKTRLEPSLQLSIVTIAGYVGAIAAIGLALAGLGIDLQKVALVAGALSVGIGFGLQSIVSNFVSGLILLAERPIRVGDSIVVKGEEGWVRRIRVRATEIETFERASVIIPNSELITGMVKNWTHANTLGRIVVKVGVAYDSDPEQVRDLLVALANEHPQVVQAPPPRAFLVGFGESAIDFELRCVVANVENGLSVKSELQVELLKRFRAAGIVIPYPQREVRMLSTRRADGEVSGPAA